MTDTFDDSRRAARAAFAGLTYEALTGASLRRLIQLIDRRMVASGALEGELRMRRVLGRRAGGAYLLCCGGYFDDREAVSFHPDGFIGFAGWADDRNILPITGGFLEWCAEVRSGGAPA